MTDNEIIKAFEQHIERTKNIKYGARKKTLVDAELLKDILDLINSQQAEIETLKAHEEKEHQYCKNVCEPKYKEEIEWLKKLLAEEEAKHTQCAKRFYKEGIKDFAKRLKDYYINHKRYKRPYAHTLVDVLFDVIDNLVKEMVGDNNAE